MIICSAHLCVPLRLGVKCGVKQYINAESQRNAEMRRGTQSNSEHHGRV
jgi:hypothetical protein